MRKGSVAISRAAMDDRNAQIVDMASDPFVTQQEIADKFAITRAYVSQILRDAGVLDRHKKRQATIADRKAQDISSRTVDGSCSVCGATFTTTNRCRRTCERRECYRVWHGPARLLASAHLAEQHRFAVARKSLKDGAFRGAMSADTAGKILSGQLAPNRMYVSEASRSFRDLAAALGSVEDARARIDETWNDRLAMYRSISEEAS